MWFLPPVISPATRIYLCHDTRSINKYTKYKRTKKTDKNEGEKIQINDFKWFVIERNVLIEILNDFLIIFISVIEIGQNLFNAQLK